MAPTENAFTGKWTSSNGKTQVAASDKGEGNPAGKANSSIRGPKSPAERNANTVTKTTRGRTRHTGAGITSTRRESLASAAGGITNLLGKGPTASQNIPTFRERRSSLEDATFAVRNTKGNAVVFSENLVSTNDSTALPSKHDQPRWVEHPKWVMCRECSKWRRIIPGKTQKPPRRSRCSCHKGALDAETVELRCVDSPLID